MLACFQDQDRKDPSNEISGIGVVVPRCVFARTRGMVAGVVGIRAAGRGAPFSGTETWSPRQTEAPCRMPGSRTVGGMSGLDRCHLSWRALPCRWFCHGGFQAPSQRRWVLEGA